MKNSLTTDRRLIDLKQCNKKHSVILQVH